MLLGYDVSEYQVQTPLDGGFLVVKCTEGVTVVDGAYSAHLAAARAAGIPTDHYLFLRNDPAAAQVGWFVQHADVRSGEAVWVDWEDPAVSAAVKDEVIAGLQGAYPAACVGLYTNASMWGSGTGAGDGLWIAEYGVQAPTVGPWVCWQYAADTIDRDQWNGDRAAWDAWHTSRESEMSVTERDYPILGAQVVAVVENPATSAAGATAVWATIGVDTLGFAPGVVPTFRVAMRSATKGWVIDPAVAVANGVPTLLAVPADCQVISVSPSTPAGVAATLHVVTRFR